ncbi:paralyzed flagella protein 22, partial [Haematococcus lacustris]
MDEQNVHQFYGISPAIDLLELCNLDDSADSNEPVRILQVASYDCRHTLYTMCRLNRHSAALGNRPVHLYVYEEEAEVLARHLVLWSVMLDAALPARERVEVLLELHGNALLRERTADYL